MNLHQTAPAAESPFRFGTEVLLSPLERHVVVLSLADPLSSVSAPGRYPRLRWLLGGSEINQLACPRLEALRRYAVRCRLSGNPRDTEDEAAMQAAGYSQAQIATVETLVSTHSLAIVTDHFDKRPLVPARAGFIATLLLGIVLGAWLTMQLTDPLPPADCRAVNEGH